MQLEATPLFFRRPKFLDLERTPSSRPTPSIVEPPTLELKLLPIHLKYAYLEKSNKLHVIIFAFLIESQEELLKMLWKHKRALGWTTVDIRGINPCLCTHKILMEDKHKPKVQPQMRLNPSMRKVVKAKIIKLLDTGIIYPISDSSWVSPMQVVPKKGKTTVIKNDQDELFILGR